MSGQKSIQDLMDTLPQQGTVEWIGVRPARGEAMIELEAVEISLDNGLAGDRYGGGRGSDRQVTLIQHEHLQVVAACLGRDTLSPSLLRRNIVVSGLNLLALKNKCFHIGDAILEYTGLCHPCSNMERLLGAGGYNAMRGHGGITASVVEAGKVRRNDRVSYDEDATRQKSLI